LLDTLAYIPALIVRLPCPLQEALIRLVPSTLGVVPAHLCPPNPPLPLHRRLLHPLQEDILATSDPAVSSSDEACRDE